MKNRKRQFILRATKQSSLKYICNKYLKYYIIHQNFLSTSQININKYTPLPYNLKTKRLVKFRGRAV